MQDQIICNSEKDSAALPVHKPSPLLQLAHARGRRYIRIVLPAAPRRQLSVSERNRRAALFATQLGFWQASGGDFLRTVAAPNFLRTAAVSQTSRSASEPAKNA